MERAIRIFFRGAVKVGLGVRDTLSSIVPVEAGAPTPMGGGAVDMRNLEAWVDAPHVRIYNRKSGVWVTIPYDLVDSWEPSPVDAAAIVARVEKERAKALKLADAPKAEKAARA